MDWLLDMYLLDLLDLLNLLNLLHLANLLHLSNLLDLSDLRHHHRDLIAFVCCVFIIIRDQHDPVRGVTPDVELIQRQLCQRIHN